MAAVHTVRGVLFQLGVVVRRHGVPGQGQVVILVDEAHVQPSRAGLAVVAVHAVPYGVLRRKGAENAVIPFLRRGVKKAQQMSHIVRISDSRQYREHAGLVQRVLDALILGERFAEGGRFSIQQLAAGKRLHNRNAHALRFAPAIELHPMAGAAVGIVAVLVGVLSLTVIIPRIDGKHQLFHQTGIQYHVRQLRRMGGQSDVLDGALLLHLQQIRQYAVFLVGFPVGGRVETVDKAVVHVVCFQIAEHPVDLLLYLLQIGGPAILACFIVGSEMDLIVHILPQILKRFAVVWKGFGPGAGQIRIVDSALMGKQQRLYGVLL